MAAQPEAIHRTGPVRAELRYIVDTGERPRTYISPQRSGTPSRRVDSVDIREMPIHDAWPLVGEASLDREGFELHRQPSGVSDFYDDEEVERVHYPEIEGLIRRATGAFRVSIFDYTRRSAGDKRSGVRDPVRSVHNDYTPKSGPQRVRDLFPYEAEGLLKRRFAVINAWHSIGDRVESHPLAVCDARSIEPKDLIATDLVYEGPGRRSVQPRAQPRPPMVLLPRAGAGSDHPAQVLRLRRRRPRPLHRPHRLRGPGKRRRRAAPREHRAQGTGVLRRLIGRDILTAGMAAAAPSSAARARGAYRAPPASWAEHPLLRSPAASANIRLWIAFPAEGAGHGYRNHFNHRLGDSGWCRARHRSWKDDPQLAP